MFAGSLLLDVQHSVGETCFGSLRLCETNSRQSMRHGQRIAILRRDQRARTSVGWEAVNARSERVDWTRRVHGRSRWRTFCNSWWAIEILEA